MSKQALIAAALLLSFAPGCQAPPSVAPARPGIGGGVDAAAAGNAPDAARGPVEGVATYAARIKMPPGASLRVEALNASGRIVAATTVRDVAGPPIRFSIATPRTGISLRAMLDGPDGERWFETPLPVAVPASGGPVELRMQRSTGRKSPAAAATAAVAHWECGELGVMSRLEAGMIKLSYNGTTRSLSATGATAPRSYSDKAGHAFRVEDSLAALTLAGEQARDCVPARQPSPWNQAVLDGAVLRAVGNEPGWHAQISRAPAMLSARLDDGEHVLETPVRATATGYEGDGIPGKPLRLLVRRGSCRDAMSGQQFEATVTLHALGRTYSGCGADPRD